MMPLTEDSEVIAQFVEICDGFVLLVVMMLIHVIGEKNPRDLNRLAPMRDALEFES